MLGEGLRRSFATPNLFVLTNKICLNQNIYVGVQPTTQHMYTI